MDLADDKLSQNSDPTSSNDEDGDAWEKVSYSDI